jgi:hypothetical protein
MEIEMREIDEDIKNKNDKTIFINFIEKNNKLKKIKIYVINSVNRNKYKILNKSLTICAHILIMVIFEIYFFFGFVVDIENDKFIGKIDSYFRHTEPVKVSPIEKDFINQMISNKYEDKFIKKLFINYVESIKEQNEILHYLLNQSYKMAGILGIIFVILLGLSIGNRKYIEWKIIIIENIIMFLFLGIFEYYFFINIIMRYEPVTNEEIQYKLTSGFIGYLNRSEVN